jgi:amino acid transporter
VHIGLGRTLGTGAATLALVAYTLLGVSVYAFLGASASAVIENGFGVAVPWWVCGFVAVALVGFLGYRDIELSAKVLAVLMCCEVAIVLVMDIAIIARGGDAGLNLLPFAPSTLAQSIAPATGLMFAFLSFIGFEATAVFRNEAKNPERTIPRATYIAVLGIGLFYTFSSWAVVMGAGVENSVAIASADPDNFSINLAREYVAPIAGDIMQVLLVTSWLACILSLHNVTTRYHFTLGGKGVLPKALAEVNAKHRSPSKASLATTAGAVVLVAIIAAAGLDPVSEGYAWLAGVSTLGIVALMTMTSLAVVLYFRRTHHPASAFIAPVISFIALLGVLGLTIANYPLLVGSTTAAVVLGGVTVLSFAAGIAIAQIMRVARPAKFATLGD